MRLLAVLALIVLTSWKGDLLRSQVSVRPDDPLGLSVAVSRLRIAQGTSTEDLGTSRWLILHDPWLAYELGRDVFRRDWGPAEGVFQFQSGHRVNGAATSCGGCHGQPLGSPGAGAIVSAEGGYGRRSRALFGAGLLEAIGTEMRAQIMARLDQNRNGIIDYPEETRGRRVTVSPAEGITLDLGTFDDLDHDGFPDLNPALMVHYLDRSGRVLNKRSDQRASSLDTPGLAGFDIAMGVFSSTQGDHQFPTIRAFAVGSLQNVFGLGVADPVISPVAGSGTAWAGISPSGTRQPYFELGDIGTRRPCQSVTTGELDVLEWYLVNHPAPAQKMQTAETRRGHALMEKLACTSCHQENWEIAAGVGVEGSTGDPRFFQLDIEGRSDGLRGRLKPLTQTATDATANPEFRPRRDHVTISGVFTDLRHHDLGARFYDYAIGTAGVTIQRFFRTPPLWGVGSTQPYGHDGRSRTLEDVILRHAGEAAHSAALFSAAPAADRRALVAFLESLILYSPDMLPTDLNGDGVIEDRFNLGSGPAGGEFFRPQLLFQIPPQFEGVSGNSSSKYFSYSLRNTSSIYRLDAIRDGWLRHGGSASCQSETPNHRLTAEKETSR